MILTTYQVMNICQSLYGSFYIRVNHFVLLTKIIGKHLAAEIIFIILYLLMINLFLNN